MTLADIESTTHKIELFVFPGYLIFIIDLAIAGSQINLNYPYFDLIFEMILIDRKVEEGLCFNSIFVDVLRKFSRL